MKRQRLPLRLGFLGCLIALVVSGATFAAPNIIHIVADDLGWTDIETGLTNNGNGSALYQTPNIDRLATEGMAFTSAYALQTCSPTRAALMTGQYATRTGVYNVGGIEGDAGDLLVGAANTNVIAISATTIGETLQTASYTTAHFGKFHITQSTADITAEHGFDVDFGGGTTGGPGTYFAAQRGVNWRFGNSIGPGLDPYADPYTQAYIDANLQPFANGADVDSLVGTAKHLSDAMADAAIDFISGQIGGGQPFYMNVAFNAVHTPIESRPDLETKYDDIVAGNGGVSPDPRHDDTGYAGLVEGMDQAIGRVLAAIEDPNGDGDNSDSIADNTLVMFYGDNGGQSRVTDNSPLRAGKGSLYEGGIRVPLIAWMPGTVVAGASSDEPIHSVDFYPTVAEFAGATLPNAAAHELDGESLGGLLRGEMTALKRNAIYYHYPGYQGQNVPTSTVVINSGDNRMKLMYFYEKRTFELYDLNSDIGETTNLADGDMTVQQYRLAALAVKQLRDWLDETGAIYSTVRADGNLVPPPSHLPAFNFDLGQSSGNDLDGLATAQLLELGVSLSLSAQGAGATFDADATGIGIVSSLDTGGAAQQRNVNGQLATPEAIEFSFDQDVMIKSLYLDALNTIGAEEVVMEFLSGDNPFTGISGYDSDGFTLGANTLTFAASSAGSTEFSLDLGILGKDEIFLTAGTVLSLTADLAVGGGLLLNSISVAQPLEAVSRILLDYNLDGNIDGDDLLSWEAEIGVDDGGDADGDGDTDGQDFLLWQRNVALAAAASTFAAVPEPGSMNLCVLFCGAISVCRRHEQPVKLRFFR